MFTSALSYYAGEKRVKLVNDTMFAWVHLLSHLKVLYPKWNWLLPAAFVAVYSGAPLGQPSFVNNYWKHFFLEAFEMCYFAATEIIAALQHCSFCCSLQCCLVRSAKMFLQLAEAVFLEALGMCYFTQDNLPSSYPCTAHHPPCPYSKLHQKALWPVHSCV